jgi:hypothetical protein
MVWKGVILKGSLEEESILKLISIVEVKKDRYNFEVKEEVKEEFIRKAIKNVKSNFYIHLVKNKVMYVIFRDHMFKFSPGYPELETAREYGKSIGIIPEQMPFEHLVDHPFD